jgi:hypothetical protein
MSRLLRATFLAFPIVLASATVAVAQTTTYPPSFAPTASVAGAGGGTQDAAGGAGGTAFTGGPAIGTGTIIMVLLLIAGLTALYVGWRRAERLTDTR